MPEISIAAPAYNEGDHIEVLVTQWIDYLKRHHPDGSYEIVICNDGSRDETGAILEKLANVNPCLRPCAHAVNQGAAAALSTAIRMTRGRWVFLVDSDGQYPIENLERFLRAAQTSALPAYIGYRTKKEDSPFARFGSWASGWCCNLFHGVRYRDFNCALKLVEGALLRDLCLEAKGLNYSTEISSKILERGVVMGEVEAIHQPRSAGRSSRTLLRGSWHRLLFVLYLGWRQACFHFGVLQRRTFPPT
jgi:glycosyltransferase involved in cell wall biosynthesis